MKPSPERSILNRAREYIPSHKTDLHAAFAKYRAEMAAQQKAKDVPASVVQPIRKAK